MSEYVYRFQVHFKLDRDKKRTYKFVADFRPIHGIDLKSWIRGLTEYRSEKYIGPPTSQGEIFYELWDAWQKRNRKLAAKLPGKFPDCVLTLKKLRQKEFGTYSNPQIIMELLDAWRRQNPKDAAEIDRRIKERAE